MHAFCSTARHNGTADRVLRHPRHIQRQAHCVEPEHMEDQVLSLSFHIVYYHSLTALTRFTLNYKGIPYRTEWVDYPDIASLAVRLGVSPITLIPGKAPRHTLPMIHDPNTETTVVDSQAIARYLDKTYPATPTLLPDGSNALQAAFMDFVFLNVYGALGVLIDMKKIGLSERGFEHISTVFAGLFGKSQEERRRENGDELWKTLEDGLTKICAWLDGNGAGKDLLVMGDKVCFADLQLAALLTNARVVWGRDSEEWKRVCSWNEGKWERYLAQFEPYMTVDNA